LLYAALFLLQLAGALYAQTATVWNYKGSVVGLSQSGSNVIIAYQTLSDALVKSGAHVGDPLFRGQRSGDALTGKVYRFFGPPCQPMGFGVEGSIEGDKITLHGIAPGLGLNSCKVETTYYDTLVLTAVAAPGETQQATLSSGEAGAFKGNVARCRTGDKNACAVVLASPLLTEDRRAEMEAAAALPAAAASPVYLLFPFECVIEHGRPIFKHSSEPYYHEALDYRPSSSYAVCSPDKGGWVKSPITTCHVIGLTSVRLVCKNGIANAAELTPATNTTFAKAARVYGDSLLVPIFNLWRETDTPDGFHRLPEGWGLLPQPNAITSAKSLEAFFAPKHIPVSGSPAEVMPQSFFLTLADWKPAPHIIVLVAFLTAAVFAGFGFSLYPSARLSPRRPIFWVWLIIACVGIGAALSAGDSIKEAFEQGPKDAAAIAQEQSRLQSLFPRRDGHVEPFAKHDLDLTRDLQRPRTIVNAAAVAAGAPMEAFLCLLPALIFLLVYARFIYAGYHFFFSRHPIEAAGGEALRTGALFDLQKVREAFETNPEHLFNPPPLHESLSKLRRGKAFREQTEVDADLAAAMSRRDRARAAKLAAEAELRAMKQKLSWWRRWW
jgi:hypothetical protein